MFRFRQFNIDDSRCAMKVGTDGVLLGAWAEGENATKAADIGTGCGLVAIMLAQRFAELHIDAVEIDAEAARQAAENAAESPYGDRISVIESDAIAFATHETPGTYDLIVSNPPYFQETLLPPDAARARARHTAAGLDFSQLAEIAATLLRPGGNFAAIIPKDSEATLHSLCNLRGLSLIHATDVRTTQRKPARRILMLFSKGPAPQQVIRDEITLMAGGQRTEAYTNLCRDFYL